MKIIGNKDNFAVEYRVTNVEKMIGYGKLWIQNSFFGTSEDLIYLNGSLVSLIEDILKAQSWDIESDDYEPGELFKKLENQLNFTSDYLVKSSTFTDDFVGFKFSRGDEIVLAWKTLNRPDTTFNDLRAYPKSTVVVKFHKNAGETILKKLKEDLKKTRA